MYKYFRFSYSRVHIVRWDHDGERARYSLPSLQTTLPFGGEHVTQLEERKMLLAASACRDILVSPVGMGKGMLHRLVRKLQDADKHPGSRRDRA